MPRVDLTTRFLDALKPKPGARVEYLDTVAAGLALRITDTGVKTWTLRYRTTLGERRRLTLGQYPDVSLKKARTRAAVERGQVADGQDPAMEKALEKQEARQAIARPTDTIAALVAEYMTKHAKVKKRSWRDDQRMFDAEVLPHWKDRSVKDLTRRDVRDLVEAIADRGSPVTANRCLALVRGTLNFAIGRDWVDANVAALIQRPGAERSRERVLTEDEIRLVWAACETERPAMCALLRLRLVTAQRGGELASLRWTDIDAAGAWMTIPGTVTKNRENHRVPLTATASAILNSLPRIDGCEWVFPGRSDRRPLGDAKKGGKRVGQRVLEQLRAADPRVTSFDFRAHDLRRTASTYMAEAGVSPADIAKVLNHAEGGPRATQIYNRYQYDKEKRIAVEAWERRLLTILEQRPAPAVVPFAKAVK